MALIAVSKSGCFAPLCSEFLWVIVSSESCFVPVDSRDVLDRDAWQAVGFTYKGVGR